MADYYKEKLLLVNNPFKEEKESTNWASSKETLESFQRFLGNFLVGERTNYFLVWGELGTGKTYTEQYFHQVGLQKLMDDLVHKGALPQKFRVLNFPRLVTTIGGRRDTQFLEAFMKNMGDELERNQDAQKVLRDFFPAKGESKSFMESARLRLASSGLLGKILAKIKSADQLASGISNLNFGENLEIATVQEITDLFVFTHSLLTNPSSGFNHVFFWIDEMERFEHMTSLEFIHNNQFFRECYDFVPNYLTFVFLWTLETGDITRIESILTGAVWSRIGQNKKLDLLSRDDALRYVKLKLAWRRSNPNLRLPEYYPFADACVKELLGYGSAQTKHRTPLVLSHRKINDIMGNAISSLVREQFAVTPQKPVTFAALSPMLPQ
jgi:hypothetical protein